MQCELCGTKNCIQPVHTQTLSARYLGLKMDSSARLKYIFIISNVKQLKRPDNLAALFCIFERNQNSVHWSFFDRSVSGNNSMSRKSATPVCVQKQLVVVTEGDAIRRLLQSLYFCLLYFLYLNHGVVTCLLVTERHFLHWPYAFWTIQGFHLFLFISLFFPRSCSQLFQSEHHPFTCLIISLSSGQIIFRQGGAENNRFVLMAVVRLREKISALMFNVLYVISLYAPKQ